MPLPFSYIRICIVYLGAYTYTILMFQYLSLFLSLCFTSIAQSEYKYVEGSASMPVANSICSFVYPDDCEVEANLREERKRNRYGNENGSQTKYLSIVFWTFVVFAFFHHFAFFT